MRHHAGKHFTCRHFLGLRAANDELPSKTNRNEEIPDLLGDSSICMPEFRCPGVFIAGDITAKGSWEPFKLPPYISEYSGGIDIDAPSAVTYYRFSRKYQRAANLYPGIKILHIMNAGLFHLNNKPMYFVPKGSRPDLYFTDKVKRQKYLENFALTRKKNVYKNYVAKNDFLQIGALASMLQHRLGQISEYSHPRVMYAWRATYPLNQSDPEVAALVENATFSPNEIIEAWNDASARVAARTGVLVVDGRKAQRQNRKATSLFQPRFASADRLHDHGRRVQLQILLNALAPQILRLQQDHKQK